MKHETRPALRDAFIAVEEVKMFALTPHFDGGHCLAVKRRLVFKREISYIANGAWRIYGAATCFSWAKDLVTSVSRRGSTAAQSGNTIRTGIQPVSISFRISPPFSKNRQSRFPYHQVRAIGLTDDKHTTNHIHTVLSPDVHNVWYARNLTTVTEDPSWFAFVWMGVTCWFLNAI